MMLALSAGCSGPAKPTTAAPAPTAAPRELHIAHIDGSGGLDPAAQWFADALAKRSGGQLTAVVDFSCCGGDADVEQQLIRKVAAGEIALGWVGVRAMHAAGTTAFDPLVTPLLLRSYAAMEKVLAEDAVTKPMLVSSSSVGVVGLGVFPGALRYPISTEKPLTDPKAFAGLPFYSFESEVSFDALDELGVSPLHLSFEQRDAGIEAGTIKALDNSLVYQAERSDSLPFLVDNVPLWARISALIASPTLALDDGERAWIAQAVKDTVARTDDLEDLDRDATIGGCEHGSNYAHSSAAEVTAFQERLAPVERMVAAEAGNADAVAEIRRLVDDLPVPEPLDCRSARVGPTPSSDAGASRLNGTFRTIRWTRDILLAHGATESHPGELDGWNTRFTITFDNGSFTWAYDDPANGKGMDTCTGTYAVTGDRVALTVNTAPVCGSGLFYESAFALAGDTLRLSDISTNPLDAIFFGTEPLSRVT